MVPVLAGQPVTFLLTALRGVGAKLALIGGLLLAGALAVWRILAGARAAGRAEAKAEQQEATLDAIEQRKEIDDEVDRLDGDAARRELLDKWSRP
jgi:hypothetical protein